jgi:hypothetical protein
LEALLPCGSLARSQMSAGQNGGGGPKFPDGAGRPGRAGPPEPGVTESCQRHRASWVFRAGTVRGHPHAAPC